MERVSKARNFPRPRPMERLISAVVAFYRLFRPIPNSPPVLPGDDPEGLTLVPPLAYQHYISKQIKTLIQMGSTVGDYAEFGVYNGTSLISACRAYEASLASDFLLVGFDSFQGLPPDAASIDGGVWKPGQFRCSYNTAVHRIRSAGVPAERYKLLVGWYRDTLKPEGRKIFHRPVSLVLIDCDTYDSARLALDFIYPCLADVSIIMFDDWRLNDLDLKCMGERRAYTEFLRENPTLLSRRVKSYNRKSNAFLLRRLTNGGGIRWRVS
jgi:O-methyltransferase